MSFIAIPSRLCTPSVPNLSYYNDGAYCGSGADAGKYAFHTSLGYIIAANFACNLKIDGTIYTPVFNNVNGYIYWSIGSNYIYRSVNFGWFFFGQFPGYEPEEYYDSEESKYKGDSFWAGSIPTIGSSSTFSPRGSNRTGGSSKTVQAVWDRWQSNTRFGEYNPQECASGKLYLGLPRWVDGNGEYYVRSVSKIDGKYTYGSIVYNNGKWIIGTINDESGWWEGSEPSKSGSTLFQFKVPEGSTIIGQNKTITFHDYVIGDERIEIYLSEVAVWR